jgi:hypothetical protein
LAERVRGTKFSGSGRPFQYDVTADGKRFLLDTIDSGSASAPLLNVVVNWHEGLYKNDRWCVPRHFARKNATKQG